ncbi:hypothetical protein J6590_053616 [Homalodisca vitripennis]|nr:hypothetical protein J6590_053616 [Homalodisca vitripennis]
MLGAVSPDSFDTLHSYSNTFQMPFVTPWFPEKYPVRTRCIVLNLLKHGRPAVCHGEPLRCGQAGPNPHGTTLTASCGPDMARL